MAEAKKTVLIVEDEKPLLKLMTEKLEESNFNVLQALNGKTGLSSALKEHPDLILLDIIMPQMDGMTMLRELRKDEWGKEADVVILTNLSDSEKTAEAAELGTDSYIIKTDLNLADLIKMVQSRLD